MVVVPAETFLEKLIAAALFTVVHGKKIVFRYIAGVSPVKLSIVSDLIWFAAGPVLAFFAHDVPEKQMASIIRTAAAFFNIDQLPPHFLKDYHRAAMIYTGQILVVLLPKYTNNPISVYNI